MFSEINYMEQDYMFLNRCFLYKNYAVHNKYKGSCKKYYPVIILVMASKNESIPYIENKEK